MAFMLPSLTKEEVLSARKRLGMTQRQMAYDCGVTERTYRRWEKETGAGPTASKVIRSMINEEDNDNGNTS